MAYPVNESASATTIPISSYTRSHRDELDEIDVSQASHLVDVPRINKNRSSSDYVEDILRSYTIYSEIFDKYDRLGKLIKIEKTPGVTSKKLYFFEFDMDEYRSNASRLFYDPNEYVGSKGNKSTSKGGKKRKTRKIKYFTPFLI